MDPVRATIQTILPLPVISAEDFQHVVGKIVYAQYILQAYPRQSIRPLLESETLSDLASSSKSTVTLTPQLKTCLSTVLISTLAPGVKRPLAPPRMVLPHILFSQMLVTRA